MALRIARARLVITVRRKALPAACPLHHPLFGGWSPSRRCAGEVKNIKRTILFDQGPYVRPCRTGVLFWPDARPDAPRPRPSRPRAGAGGGGRARVAGGARGGV